MRRFVPDHLLPGRFLSTRFGPDLAAVGAGLLLAAALPPWGWWPLAIAGVVVLDRLIAGQPRRIRFRRGIVVGLALYVPSMFWMQEMTVPGYLIACLFYSLLLGVAAVVTPATAPARWLALPGAIALTELLRWSWPFGGVPLSSLAIGQVAGPLAPVLRVGGALLLVEVTVVCGVVVAAALQRRWISAGIGAVAVVVLIGLGASAPRAAQTGTINLAAVQGGGEQGTRAVDTDEREVFERHRDATAAVRTPVDLVLWPEDVVDVEGTFEDTRERRELRALARSLDAPLVVGVVEGIDDDHFRNASVVLDAGGDVVDRYDKVHRVPFGEYVPLRGLVERFAGESLTDRDAIVGERPARVDTPAGRMSVAISWEIFFGDRVREGVEDGAGVVLNPTNGSSFTGTLVQTQQIATSRMRAIENDRWVVQVAPTGFSAIIRPDGTVVERTAISEQAVIQGPVGVRAGTTIYTRWGLLPALMVALAGLPLGWALAWRDSRREPGPAALVAFGQKPGRPSPVSTAVTGPGRDPMASDLEEDGDRSVVDELHAHVGPESPGRHRGAEGT